MKVEEMVAMFLHILGHDEKNRAIHHDFQRSTGTVSVKFRLVLGAVLKLCKVLLKKPKPIPANCTDGRWSWFKVSNLSQNYNNLLDIDLCMT